MKKKITKYLIAYLHVLYKEKGLDDMQKESLLSDLTDGRVAHTNELTNDEAVYLCGYLNGSNETRGVELYNSVLRRRRSGCLKLMQQIGVDTTDWSRINTFCLNKRIAGKSFAEMIPEELLALHKKLLVIKHKKEIA